LALDNFRKINITLNKANQHILEPQIAKVGDVNGRELVVQLIDGGVIKDQTGVSLKLNWQHANGNQGAETFSALDASQGVFSVYYPENMLFRGTVTANISINENGKITNSLNFQIAVKGDVFDGSAIEVDGLLFTLKDLKDQLDERDDILETLENRQSSVENQFNSLQQEITNKDVISAPEIIAARGGKDTLGQRLDDTTSQLAQNLTLIKSDVIQQDLDPFIIDMHYGVLKGVGWVNETYTETEFPVTSISLKGTKTINVNGVDTVFKVGQLICYTDKNGAYQSNVITALTTSQITVAEPLQEDLNLNSKVMNFYFNSAHPSEHGFRTIADYSINELIKPTGRMVERIEPQSWSVIDTNTTLSDVRSTTQYYQPFGKFDARQVSILALSSGVKKKIDIFEAGITKIRLNLNSVADGEIKITITDKNSVEIYSKTLNNGVYIKQEEITMSLDVGTYYVNIVSVKSTGTATVYLGAMEIYNCDKKYTESNINRGVHLLLGDSWFEFLGLPQRLQERLPLANIINYGVGGNKADQLIRRFTGTATDADIKNNPTSYGGVKDATTIPHIDYVWIMTGTNDYYAGKTADVYQNEVKELIDLVISRGAKPIVFNASVGIATSDNNVYDLSRQYADFYTNINNGVSLISDSVNDLKNTRNYLINFANVEVPVGESYLGSFGVVKNTEKVIVEEIGFNRGTNKDIKITYAGNIEANGTYEKQQTISTAYNLTEIDFGKPTTNKWFVINAFNNTSAATKYTGYVRLRVESIN